MYCGISDVTLLHRKLISSLDSSPLFCFALTLRMAARLLQRLGGSVRRMTTTAAGEDFKRKMVEEEAHAGGIDV